MKMSAKYCPSRRLCIVFTSIVPFSFFCCHLSRTSSRVLYSIENPRMFPVFDFRVLMWWHLYPFFLSATFFLLPGLDKLFLFYCVRSCRLHLLLLAVLSTVCCTTCAKLNRKSVNHKIEFWLAFHLVHFILVVCVRNAWTSQTKTYNTMQYLSACVSAYTVYLAFPINAHDLLASLTQTLNAPRK